jgi:hypothetical protein
MPTPTQYIVEIESKKSQIYKYDNVMGVEELYNMIVLLSKRGDQWVRSYFDPDQIQSFTYKEKSNE